MVNSRRKGINGELEAAKLWRRWFPDCRRSFGQARDGYEQPDLIGGMEKDFYVEVKRTKKFRESMICGTGRCLGWWAKMVGDWLEWQKENDPQDESEPVLMWREDGGAWWVMVMDGLGQELGVGQKEPTSWSDFAAAMDKIYPVREHL